MKDKTHSIVTNNNINYIYISLYIQKKLVRFSGK